MVGVHPRAELAPRDVVVRHMKAVMDRDGIDHVWLDARHLDCEFLSWRFPTVHAGLKSRGYDLCSEVIPIAPASHYFIGGVMTDIWGRTSIPGLYACGETASTGIHGANRLASNSLREGLVFGDRTVRDVNRYLSVSAPAVRKVRLGLTEERRSGNSAEAVRDSRAELGRLMTEWCGIVRNGEGLEQARRSLRGLRESLERPGLTVRELELFNLLSVAEHIVESAWVREESRGVHLRSDFPSRDDARWRRHVVLHDDPVTGGPVVELSQLEVKDDPPR